MSFIRPELQEQIWRWREVILLLAIILVSAVVFLTGGGLARVITAGLVVIGLAFLYPAIRQARTYTAQKSVGVVEITERRIRYLGPQSGDEISANDLRAVEIETHGEASPDGAVTWVFTDIHGKSLFIPSGAEGARSLMDAISSLPGVDLDAVVRAMGYPKESVFTIWLRG